jgi:5-methylcytosine-specific restriction endonuclease McrA
MSDYVAKNLRKRIAVQARHRCGYCLTAEKIVGARMEVDHIIPRALGGLTEENNLWLACAPCNEYKGVRMVAFDTQTDELVPLFNPRRQNWSEHFAWTPEGDRVVGLTPIGRASVVALNLNRPTLVHARQIWVAAGWHPPKD